MIVRGELAERRISGKRVVFPQLNHVECESFGLSTPTPTQVVIESVCSLISTGTERTALSGTFSADSHWARWVKYPFYPGYSCVGVICGVGSNVDKKYLGTRVAVRASHATHHVVDLSDCLSIPAEIATHDAVWFALARISLLGVLAARFSDTSSVLVIGGGPVGQLVVRWLAYKHVSLISIVTRSARAQLLAAKGGAKHVVAGTTQAFVKESLTPSRRPAVAPNIIMDCTTDPSVLGWACGHVADYGQIILLGDPGIPTARSLTGDVLLRGISVVGVHDRLNYGCWTNEATARAFFSAVAEKRFDVDGLCTSEYPICKAPSAYDQLLRPEGGYTSITFSYGLDSFS